MKDYLKSIKNKDKKAEIWEIQTILYLILAQLIETDFIAWLIRIYAFWVFGATLYILWLEDKEKLSQPPPEE